MVESKRRDSTSHAVGFIGVQRLWPTMHDVAVAA